MDSLVTLAATMIPIGSVKLYKQRQDIAAGVVITQALFDLEHNREVPQDFGCEKHLQRCRILLLVLV
jgi:hypothetical protein